MARLASQKVELKLKYISELDVKIMCLQQRLHEHKQQNRMEEEEAERRSEEKERREQERQERKRKHEEEEPEYAKRNKTKHTK